MKEVEDYSNGFPPRKVWVNLTAVKLIEPYYILDPIGRGVDMFSLYLGGNRYVIVSKEEGDAILVEMLEILLKMLKQ